MQTTSKLAAVGAALALSASPGLALGASGNSGAHANPRANSTPGHHGSTPGPKASLPAKAKAYGRYCQGESKKHVKGHKGTPFSLCVSGGAKLKHNQKHGGGNQ